MGDTRKPQQGWHFCAAPQTIYLLPLRHFPRCRCTGSSKPCHTTLKPSGLAGYVAAMGAPTWADLQRRSSARIIPSGPGVLCGRRAIAAYRR